MDLYINTYGAYLHVKDDMFEIRVKDEEGNERRVEQAAFKVRSIILHRGMSLSTDAVHLALKNNVDIVFLENSGRPLGRVWHSKHGSTTKIRKKQLEASLNVEGLEWVKAWITAKLQNQSDFLTDLRKHRKPLEPYLNERIGQILKMQHSIQSLKGGSIGEVAETIRGLEGTAGRLYFEAFSESLPEVYRFNGRSSRPAKDAFNAFLNYVYGVLYAQVERALVLAGVDPYVGFLHRDDYNQLSMVYDFIEPYRVYAEHVVFRLFSAKKVNKSHTDPLANGFSLNKEGKVLLMEAFNKHYREEKIRYNGRNQSRDNILQLDAHAFAQQLIST
jgi:CRISPR-associated protein Cas1